MRATLLAVLLLTPALAPAQVERYELGRRLKRFEAEWEKQTDPAARKRALAILPKASTQFLSLQLTEAARTVDDAYWALKSAEPPPAGVRWLDSLCVVPEKRVVDYCQPVRVTVRPLYPVDGGPPRGVTARLVGPMAATVPVPLDPLPKAVLDIPTTPSPPAPDPNASNLSGVAIDARFGPTCFAGDGRVAFETRTGEAVVFRDEVGVSVILDTSNWPWRGGGFGGFRPGMEQQTKPLPTPVEKLPPDQVAIETATAEAQRKLIASLRAGEVPETDLPVVAWSSRQGALSSRYFIASTPGDHWLTIPTGKDTVTACRLFVPPGLTKDKPVPLVVALHGAGGSENMFFESYGAGHIVKECQKRGWLLVSPRSGLLGTPPVAAVIDKLAERYPIDRKRVFLVGHSMGAGQAIDLVQRHPGTFAAVASLGGGGRVRQKERFETLPVFVGVGTADFALRSSRSLVKALADAGAKTVTAKEYPDLEHLLIVREALPDVFTMFDGVASP